jgi:hypothetical protein
MLLCDRCKKPIVGESKKLLDVCPACYDQVMNYIVAGNANVGASQARIITGIDKRFSSKAIAIIVILLILLSFTSTVAFSTFIQYEAPFQNEKSLANILQDNLTQEQSTLQTWAKIIQNYISSNRNLTDQINAINQSLANDNQNITLLQGMISSLKSNSSSLQKTVDVLQENVTQLKNRTNTFVIWNVQVNVSSGYFLLETVPDTFDFHDDFTSSVPITVYYFNSTQFVQWYTTKTISGNYIEYTNTSNQSDTFKLAEGCGGYIAIYYFSTAGTIHPNVSATYNPASHPTGSCS